jgi:hypothetical protein
MRRFLFLVMLIACGACRHEASPGAYLFVWAGDSAEKASDFLGVIDADPTSPRYGSVVTSLPTGMIGTHPHHTEAEMPADEHLLANGFHSGRSWLFDLTNPSQPRILTSFGDLAGFNHPHTYIRLANGHVLATFQYKTDSTAPAPVHTSNAMDMGGEHLTGGLVEMDERGTVIRGGSAGDSAISDKRIFPYSVLAMPAIDRAVSTTSDMDEADKKATAEWVQFWRLSDLTLLKSIALKPGPRGDEHQFTGEPRVLPDGKSVYIHTFNCGLYLVRNIDQPEPTATFVKGFEGKNCGVPILIGHYWLQPVPETHSLVAVDITDPELDRDRRHRSARRPQLGRLEGQPSLHRQTRSGKRGVDARRAFSRSRQHASRHPLDAENLAARIHRNGHAARHRVLALTATSPISLTEPT